MFYVRDHYMTTWDQMTNAVQVKAKLDLMYFEGHDFVHSRDLQCTVSQIPIALKNEPLYLNFVSVFE